MSYSYDMPPPDLTLIREFKRRAEQALPGRVVRVVLYGSRARGDARPDSDWDVAVFLASPPDVAGPQGTFRHRLRPDDGKWPALPDDGDRRIAICR